MTDTVSFILIAVASLLKTTDHNPQAGDSSKRSAVCRHLLSSMASGHYAIQGAYMHSSYSHVC